MVHACPECGATKINHRTGKWTGEETQPRYRCCKCQAEFNEPDERESQHPGHCYSRSAKDLWEADPKDWP